jgi:hypothetical protein
MLAATARAAEVWQRTAADAEQAERARVAKEEALARYEVATTDQGERTGNMAPAFADTTRPGQEEGEP